MIQITNISTSSNGNSAFVNLCLKGMDCDSVSLVNAVSKIIDFRIQKNDVRREMSVTEFAKEARITRQGVIKMINEGRLSAKRIGEQYIIEPEELTRYLQVK